jgi:hypothetical protein
MQADVERFLARLFADTEFRERFLADPAQTARENGLSAEECAAVTLIPARDLRTAARSYDRKRTLKARHKSSGVRDRLLRLLRVRN